MYKHAMLRKLKDYGSIRRMQPLLKQQIANSRWNLEKHGDRQDNTGCWRSDAVARLEETYSANREFLQDMESCFTLLNDREMAVIHHFYIERTWDYIDILSEKLAVERSQLYRIKDQAMAKLVLAYYGAKK